MPGMFKGPELKSESPVTCLGQDVIGHPTECALDKLLGVRAGEGCSSGR